MNKIILSVFGLLFISSVFAVESFSIRGSNEFNDSIFSYKVQFSSYHSEGRLPTCYANLRCSNGIEPQGKGSLSYLKFNKTFRLVEYMSFEEKNSWIQGDNIFVLNHASGNVWYKGILPIKTECDFTYKYNPSTKLVNILANSCIPGVSIKID